jgi:hypothetical protein
MLASPRKVGAIALTIFAMVALLQGCETSRSMSSCICAGPQGGSPTGGDGSLLPIDGDGGGGGAAGSSSAGSAGSAGAEP